MDIETFIKDGIHIPYCISFYDGENTFSYYLTDFKDSNSMIIKAILDLMIKKYDNYKIYLHNLANFDAIFLLKIIIKLGICKPIIHHDRIISIQLNYGDHVVFFRDSQQLLIGSLAKLGKSFGVKTLKSIFPYFFVDENNLDYVGSIPNINFFDNISRKEYLEYYENFNDKLWEMRVETIKYCNIDCISLHQIILKFNEIIFDLFKINIHKYPTLTSLAFAIFRAHFLEEETIPQLSGQVAKDIRMSYIGGACDMYIPKSEKDSNLYAYDVNSLYPSVMKDNDMPIGKPTFFKTRFFDTFRP
jgi:DNA polymerase elongation subunit (family B)